MLKTHTAEKEMRTILQRGNEKIKCLGGHMYQLTACIDTSTNQVSERDRKKTTKKNIK